MRRTALTLAALALAACATPCDADPAVALAEAALRPDNPATTDQPPTFAARDHVESFDSQGGAFRIHFTRSGAHRVPATDADGDGLPDYVSDVAREYDAILAFYVGSLGYAPPLDDGFIEDNGGDARFDVYLLDFGTTADGSFRREQCLPEDPTRCAGYMVQENDFDHRGYPSLAEATRVVASHELFHAIQAGYRAEPSVVLTEGSAVWASETYDPTLTDFEGFISGYLDRPDRSLGQEPTTAFDGFSYGSALFFRFLEERYGRDTVRELWEALRADGASGTDWLELLDRQLEQTKQSSLAEAFEAFSRANLYTSTRADAAVAYRAGATYPKVREDAVDLPYDDNLVRLFPLSAHFYSARVATKGTVAAQLVIADPALLQGLRLILAREHAGKIVAIGAAAASDGPLRLDVDTDGDTVHALLINTTRLGESRRPGFCFASAPELPACVQRLEGAPSATSQANASHHSGCSAVTPDCRRPGSCMTALALVTAAVLRPRRRRNSALAQH